LKLLLDEMYPGSLAEALGDFDIDACTVVELGLAGRSDVDVFTAGIDLDRAILTENAADFRPISAEHLMAGEHHPGLLIAVSSRFSRRPTGISRLVGAFRALSDRDLRDCVVYLKDAEQR
jgi:hypothetical protein